DAALDREGVKAVERAHCPLAHRAALRGVRIDPVEVLEIGSIARLANERESMVPRLGARRKATDTGAERHRRRGERQKSLAYATVEACDHAILLLSGEQWPITLPDLTLPDNGRIDEVSAAPEQPSVLL